MNPAVEFRNLTQVLSGRTIFRALNLEIYESEIICLLGVSGCGKSTLLKTLAGVLAPSSGVLNCARPGKDLGYMDQDEHLLPWLTVERNCTLKSRLLPGLKKFSAGSYSPLALVELTDFAQSLPTELSGGERQRINLARSLWGNPRLLLLDEPFSRLDPDLRMRISMNMRLWIKARKQSALIVTHHLEEAVTLADRVLWMAGNPASFQKELRITEDSTQERMAALSTLLTWVRTYAEITTPSKEELCTAS